MLACHGLLGSKPNSADHPSLLNLLCQPRPMPATPPTPPAGAAGPGTTPYSPNGSFGNPRRFTTVVVDLDQRFAGKEMDWEGRMAGGRLFGTGPMARPGLAMGTSTTYPLKHKEEPSKSSSLPKPPRLTSSAAEIPNKAAGSTGSSTSKFSPPSARLAPGRMVDRDTPARTAAQPGPSRWGPGGAGAGVYAYRAGCGPGNRQ